MTKLIWLLIICAFSTQSFGQNLIPNPGFEDCSKCDNRGFKELGIGSGANDPIDWNAATYGSPDIYSISPHAGKRHGGFFVGFPKFEYLLNHFTECLKLGAKYQFSFWIRPSTQNLNYIIDEIGVYIESGPGVYPQAGPLKQLNPTFQSNDGDFINQTGYRQFSFEYIAQGGEDHFIVGRFRALGLGDTTFVGNKRPANPSSEPIYYFVDDFEMKEISPGVIVDLIPNEITICPGEKKPLTIPEPYDKGDISWSTGEKTKTINVPESNLVTVEINLNDNCKTVLRDTCIINIEKDQTPIIFGPNKICNGDTIILIASCDSCTDISWNRLIVTKEGDYTVTANTKCGPVSATHHVSSFVENYPLEIKGDDKICKGDTIQLTATCIPCNGFIWNTGEITRSIQITKPDKYTVDTKSKCSSKSETKEVKSLNIELDSLLQFPNVFVPNGEPDNTTFKPLINELKRDSIISLRLYIYNRWGQKLNEINDINAKWIPDSNVPMDTYMYVCEIEYKDCDGPKKGSLKGTVTLIR